jgi:7-carboxy-7-deazaguanine synthase
MTEPTTLPVSEMFGPTVQGEGPSCGRRAMFVRLWGCNLNCSWCDTSYTWDTTGQNGPPVTKAEESIDTPIAHIVARLEELRNDRQAIAVVTGGEPMIHRRLLPVLVQELAPHYAWVEVETNGTQMPPDALRPLAAARRVRFNVSPKLTGSGCNPDRAINDEALKAFATWPGATFKFVVTGLEDLAEVLELVRRIDIDPTDVWVMAEDRLLGIDADVCAVVLAAGFNYSPRLQVALWGDTKGT